MRRVGQGLFGGGEAWPPHSTLPVICVSPCVCLVLCLPCKSACPSTLLCASCQCVQWVLLEASVVYLLTHTSVYVCHSGHVCEIFAHLSACMYQHVHVDVCIYEHTCLECVCVHSGCP